MGERSRCGRPIWQVRYVTSAGAHQMPLRYSYADRRACQGPRLKVPNEIANKD